MRTTRTRFSRVGIAALAIAPALAFAPAAVADEAEGSTPELPGSEEGTEGSGDDVNLEDIASSLADADLERIAGVGVSLSSGDVSLSTALDVIDLINGGDQTIGEVIGSVAGVVGIDAGSAEALGSQVSSVTGGSSEGSSTSGS